MAESAATGAFEAVNARAPLVPRPGGLVVAVGGRGNHCRVDQRAYLDGDRLGFKLARHLIEQPLVEIMQEQLSPEAHEGGALRSGLMSSLYVRQIVPDAQQQGLEQGQRRPTRLAFVGGVDVN